MANVQSIYNLIGRGYYSIDFIVLPLLFYIVLLDKKTNKKIKTTIILK